MRRKAIAVLFGGGRLYREALKRLLSGPDYLVESEWDDLQGALSRLSESNPDLLIVVGDYAPRELTSLRVALKTGRMVQLASRMTLAALRDALGSGVDAFLVDGMSPRGLRAAIGLALQGEKVLPTELVSILLKDGMRQEEAVSDRYGVLSDFSPRELEILGRLVGGEPNKVIAFQLDISEATVKVHLKAALKKMRAANRTQAAVWALQHGLRPHSPGI